MTVHFLIILGSPLALALAFAMARITIRLHQPPAMAMLAAVVMCWQAIALAIGQAMLASSVTLLIAAVALVALIQWLRENQRLLGAVGWGGYGLGALMAAIASLFPGMPIAETIGFLLTFGFAGSGIWIASRRARSAAPSGQLGIPSLAIMGLWLFVHLARSWAG